MLSAFVANDRKLSIKVSVVLAPTQVLYLLLYFMTPLSSNRLTWSCMRFAPIASLHLPVKPELQAAHGEQECQGQAPQQANCRLAFQEVYDFSHHGVVFFSHYLHSFFLSNDKKSFFLFWICTILLCFLKCKSCTHFANLNTGYS